MELCHLIVNDLQMIAATCVGAALHTATCLHLATSLAADRATEPTSTCGARLSESSVDAEHMLHAAGVALAKRRVSVSPPRATAAAGCLIVALCQVHDDLTLC